MTRPDPHDNSSERRAVEVESTPISYLHAGSGAPVLLLHGTFWSRVWEPVLPAIGRAGFEAFAVDFPGFGASGGRLTRAQASVPALAAWECLSISSWRNFNAGRAARPFFFLDLATLQWIHLDGRLSP